MENKKLKIGMFVDTYFPMIDGVVLCVDNYAKYLSEIAEVTVFTAEVEKDFEDNYPYKVVRCNSTPIKGLDYVLPVPSLDINFWEALRSSDLDIVHINSPFTVGLSGLRYAKVSGIPAVATMHSQFQTDFKKALKLDTLVDIATDTVAGIFNSADEIWVPNSAVAEVFRQYGGKKEARIYPNATDMLPVSDPEAAKRAVNEELSLIPEEKVFLFVGRLVIQKNIIFLADAIAELKNRMNEPFKMIFVGSGADEEELRAHIEKLGIEDVCIFTGKITERERLANLYCRADLFVFPSLYDTNSLVQIEAASQHTPSVFIEGAVTAESVKGGVNGYISEESPTSYAEIILEAMSSPEEYSRISDAAFNDLYRNWTTVIPKMYEGYERAIEEKKKERAKKYTGSVKELIDKISSFTTDLFSE